MRYNQGMDRTEPSVNPVAQLAGLLFLMIPVFLSMDVVTPLLTLAAVLPVMIPFLKPDIRIWSRVLKPLCVFSFGLFTMNILFAADTSGAERLPVFPGIRLSETMIFTAASVALRAAALGVLSTLSAASFGPTALVRALMHQCGVSPVWGYSMFAGLNVIPSLAGEIEIMNHTRKIRLYGRRRRLKDLLSLPVVLLAASLRRAERISLSMTARGLENSRNRTFLVRSVWKTKDTVYVAVCIVLGTVILFGSIFCGFFSFDLG